LPGATKKKKSPWDLSPAKPKPGDLKPFNYTKPWKMGGVIKKPTSLMNIDDRIIELDAQLDEAFEFMFPDTRGMRQKELERLAASNRAISPPKLSRKEKLMAALESAKGKAKRAGRTTRVMGKRRGRQAMRHIGRHPGKYAAGLGGLGAAALLLAGRSRND
jgi:hypothetical protein